MGLHSRLRPVSKSVRIPASLRPVVKKQMVRISLNPVLYARSRNIVRWSRQGSGHISPQAVVLRALQSYPRLSLSNAVEAVLLDLLLEEKGRGEDSFSPEERIELERFRNLPVGKKIQITQKRNRFGRYLQTLPWRETK